MTINIRRVTISREAVLAPLRRQPLGTPASTAMAVPKPSTDTGLCVVSANMGGFDFERMQPENVRVHQFNEKNTPVPLSQLSSRMKAKYFKAMTHKVLPHATGYVWCDASIRFANDDFIKLADALVGAGKMLVLTHHARATVDEEYALLIRQAGLPYFRSRYDRAALQFELDHYKRQGFPGTARLFQLGVFARPNTPEFNGVFEEWWRLLVEMGPYDQGSFAYLMWKHKLPHVMLNWRSVMPSMFMVHRHRK